MTDALDWTTPMIACLQGQIEMLYALTDLVSRDARTPLIARAARHSQLIVELTGRTSMTAVVESLNDSPNGAKSAGVIK